MQPAGLCWETSLEEEGDCFSKPLAAFAFLDAGVLKISGISSEPMVTSLSLRCFSKLICISQFELFQAFHESLVLQPGKFASYCCQTAGFPVELTAVGEQAIQSLHFQVAPHLPTVVSGVQLRRFH